MGAATYVDKVWVLVVDVGGPADLAHLLEFLRAFPREQVRVASHPPPQLGRGLSTTAATAAAATAVAATAVAATAIAATAVAATATKTILFKAT